MGNEYFVEQKIMQASYSHFPDLQRLICSVLDYHAGFSKLFRGSEVLGILEQLSGEPMVLFKEKVRNKTS